MAFVLADRNGAVNVIKYQICLIHEDHRWALSTKAGQTISRQNRCRSSQFIRQSHWRVSGESFVAEVFRIDERLVLAGKLRAAFRCYFVGVGQKCTTQGHIPDCVERGTSRVDAASGMADATKI